MFGNCLPKQVKDLTAVNCVGKTQVIIWFYVNWPPLRDSEALALCRSDSKNCGLCVVCIQRDGATPLVGAW